MKNNRALNVGNEIEMNNFCVIPTELEDCFILEPRVFGDNRGYYKSPFVQKAFVDAGVTFGNIAQISESMSDKGVLRGLHFQKDPLCQAKLVRCISGGIIDVVVDLRKDSSSYKKWTAVELTPKNNRQLLVPRGFAHGFLSLKKNSRFEYFVDSDYSVAHEGGIPWNDPDINIDWEKMCKKHKIDIKNLNLSDKDTKREPLSKVENTINFYKHKRYLVTGCMGQLGYDIVRELNSRGIYDILVLDKDDMDITNYRIVNKIISEYKPECIFHCAAYTAVDKAEADAETAFKINVIGTRNIAGAAHDIGAKLFYISTDYVFDGTKDTAYEVTDIPNPLSVYGKTKLEGEKQALWNEKTFVVRTAWVFGTNGKNFVKTMRSLAETHDTLTVVNDQIGTPTYTVDLAKLLVDMSSTEKYGTYHATNSGQCSWAEFASYILKDTNTKVIPVSTEEYYAPQFKKAKEEGRELVIANRPLSNVLSKQSLIDNGFKELPSWQEATDEFIESEKA